MKTLYVLIVLVMATVFTACNSQKTSNPEQTEIDRLAIEQVLENYKTSINQADTTLAATFWWTAPEASFIHPRGHEKGWEEIKSGIYECLGVTLQAAI